MNRFFLLVAVAALAGCDTKEAAPADSNAAAEAVVPMSLRETSWEFTRDGKDIQESIDAQGNYIAVSGTEHVDHGTYALLGGKQCFTSAMTDEGRVCWTAPAEVAVDESADITSDKGEKLTVKRVAYVPRTM